MKRYRAFDPPEYLDWQADPAVMEQYRSTLAVSDARREVLGALSPAAHLDLYRGLLRARLHDITLKRWVKTGVINKAWLATGEEAVTVGSVAALRRGASDGDVVGPMIRNAGACLEMGMPARQMFAAYLGTGDSLAQGRDLHIGDLQYGVVAPVSHVGSLQPVLVGVGLAFKMQKSDRVAMTWVGDGSTKTGEFHEGANFAAAMKLPVIIFVQNNLIALGTRTERHSKGSFEAMADVYGMAGATVDGNNVLDTYAATRLAVDRARDGQGPTMIVANTFRMGGHATHDEAEGRRLRSAEEFEHWGKRDPIGTYEAWLLESGLSLDGRSLDRTLLDEVDAEVTAEIEAAATEALERRTVDVPDPTSLLDGVYG